MTDYSHSAVALRKFIREFGGSASTIHPWMELADAIGPMSLPFVVKPERYPEIPFSVIGIKPTPLSTLCPRRGEMWVLFCFRKNAFGEEDSPIRSDGFALVLEWRKGRSDSPLLASSFHRLANDVRRQLSIVGWGLHPSFDRYGDRVSFTDPELFSDAEHIGNIASAWGALAAGLYCADADEYPSQWPFPSIQWDDRAKGVLGVAGLHEKVSVARDCGATSIVVEKKQVGPVKRFVRSLSGDGGRILVHGVSQCDNVGKIAEQIAFGVTRRRRRKRGILVAGIVIVLMVATVFFWLLYAAAVALARERAFSAVSRLSQPHGIGTSFERTTSLAWQELEQSFFLPEARAVFLRQLVGRNWLVPVEVREASPSAGLHYPVPMHSELNNRGFRMFWLPCHFANDKIMFWLNRDETLSAEQYGRRLWFRTGREWCGAETFRVAPCGLAAVAEVAFPERRLVAIDPFTGSDLWSSAIEGRISAFAFSHDGSRFAFATEQGFLRVWELKSGARVTEVARLGNEAESLCFSDDDAYLWVRTATQEIRYAICVQHDGESLAETGLDKWSEADCTEALVLLTHPVIADMVSDENGCQKELTARIREYAATAPSNRAINVLSPVPMASRVGALCQTAEGRRVVRAFWPAHRDSLLESWKNEIDDLVIRKCRVDFAYGAKDISLDEGLQRFFYAFDQQAIELEGNFLSFASRLYPDDPWVRKRALLFECWARRNCSDCKPGSLNVSQHALPQAERVNLKERDSWVADCRQTSLNVRSQERSRLELMGTLASRLVDNAYRVLSELPSSTVRSMAVIGEFNAWKNTMLALAALAAAERCSDADPLPWSKPLRQYLLQGKAGVRKSVIVVMGFANGDASKGTQLRVGDLITGRECLGNDKYQLEILRFDDTKGDFRVLHISESSQSYNQLRVSPLIKGYGQEFQDGK